MSKSPNEGVGNLTVEVYEGSSLVKTHNAVVKITGHSKLSGHFIKPVSFSANTGILGVAKFSDIPLGVYKIEVSKKWYETSIIEKITVNIPGKDPVEHFKKPNNLTKVNLFLATHLRFNGSKLCFIKKGVSSICWTAVSGRKNHQSAEFQNVKNKGPLPEGRWVVRQDEYQKMPDRNWIEMVLAEVGRTAWPGGESAWGKNRIWLHPLGRTKTYDRSGFSIHGGDSPGSAGCIDLTNNMQEFVSMFLQYGKDMLLKVNYE